MAANSLLLPVLAFLLLVWQGLAVREASWQQGKCQIRRINAQEPSNSIRAEGGVTEFWDHNDDQFRCAGASVRRHTIQPRGLLLPLYHNAPVLVYAVRGKGLFGVMISGCPETFESSQQFERSDEGRSRRDRHQKIEELWQGEIAAVPAGAAHWAYNDGNEELVLVVFHHNGNKANQLDQNPRSFFLAGNPERGQQQEQYKQQGRRREQGQQQQQFGNVFKGFDAQTLAEAFKVDEETARKLQGKNDERGHIITVDRGFQVIRPPPEYSLREQEEEQYYGGRPANGLEETICNARIRENLDKPSRADIYNPRAGRFTTANSLTLPILSYLRLGASRGVLYRNGIMAPLWYTNSHAIIYATRGESNVQIVDHTGLAVFDGRLREGQVVVVPQNFAVVKRAEEQGFEWVAFYTNDRAMINTLSGRTSSIRGLPADVLANAYQISREEAERLKSSRQETLIFGGARRGRAAAA